MPRREDDEIDVAVGLSASRDDVGRRAAPQPISKPNIDTIDESGGTAVNHQANKSGAGFKWFITLVLLLLIGACGWLGLQVLQLQQHLSDNKNTLQLERSRIESISAQVHETGSSFAKTDNVLTTKFAFFESEIRKLWDVSNKRNKENISSNMTQLKSLSANVEKIQQGLKGELDSLKKGQKQAAQVVGKLSKQVALEVSALRASLVEESDKLLLMNEEMDVLQQRLGRVTVDLANHVRINEEAIEAIDASRKQLIARMSQLQKRLDALAFQPVTPSP
jgi:chromosome segregation ATPase